MFAEQHKAWWHWYLYQGKIKCHRLLFIWLTRWRAHASVQYFYWCYLHLSSSPFLLSVSTATSSSTSWTAIFVTVSIDVEKAIIWASKSGNRVLAEVGHWQDFYCAAQPRVLGAMSSNLGQPEVAPGYFFDIHSGFKCSKANTSHLQSVLQAPIASAL